jgi:hypothetical protein
MDVNQFEDFGVPAVAKAEGTSPIMRANQEVWSIMVQVIANCN